MILYASKQYVSGHQHHQSILHFCSSCFLSVHRNHCKNNIVLIESSFYNRTHCNFCLVTKCASLGYIYQQHGLVVPHTAHILRDECDSRFEPNAFDMQYALNLGCFVFSPSLKLKMLGVACDGVLGTDSKHEKKIKMTPFRGGRPRLKLFSGGFP